MAQNKSITTEEFARQLIDNAAGEITFSISDILRAGIEIGMQLAKQRTEVVANQRKTRFLDVPKQTTLFDEVSFIPETNENVRIGAKFQNRKRPIKHNAFHHGDAYWEKIIAQFKRMRVANPKMTQREFVELLENPKINVKTFSKKWNEMLRYGKIFHKSK